MNEACPSGTKKSLTVFEYLYSPGKAGSNKKKQTQLNEIETQTKTQSILQSISINNSVNEVYLKFFSIYAVIHIIVKRESSTAKRPSV